MDDPKPTMVSPRYTDSRKEGEDGVVGALGSVHSPGFLKLSEKVCSEDWVLHAVVDCPVDTE